MNSPRGLFPPSAVLISRAWWLACDHPVPVLFLGLAGTVPWSVLLLLYLDESVMASRIAGTARASLLPLAFWLAGAFWIRCPFRFALARWMAGVSRGAAPSLRKAMSWGFLHAPTALLYGAVSVLGWLLGLVFLFPLPVAAFAGMAGHRFAVTEGGGWEVLRETFRLPFLGACLRLASLLAVIGGCVFLLLWTGPGFALSLAEWLFRADVAAIRGLFDLSNPSWGAVALVVTFTVLDLLWELSLGLLAASWEDLSGGADLEAELQALAAGSR